MATIVEYLAPSGDIPLIFRESNPGLVVLLIDQDSNPGPNERQCWMLTSDQYSYVFVSQAEAKVVDRQTGSWGTSCGRVNRGTS